MNFNARCPAVKRLMREAQELQNKTELYHAQPLEDNIFEWHFTIRGPSDTDFEGGVYHGRILLPAEYPMKPPSITFLTANGRFRVNEKICLSISGHHPETWLPSWSTLLALIGFMPTVGEGAIGSLDYTSEERKTLAKKSMAFKCETCGCEASSSLLPLTDKSLEVCNEAKELAAQIDFKNSKPNEESKAHSEADKTETAEPLRQEASSSLDDKTPNETRSNTTGQTTTTTTTTARHGVSSTGQTHSIFIIGLSLVFCFLLIRRLFLIFSNGEH